MISDDIVNDLMFVIQLNNFNRKLIFDFCKKYKLNISTSKFVKEYEKNIEHLNNFEYIKRRSERFKVLSDLITELKRDWEINKIL